MPLNEVEKQQTVHLTFSYLRKRHGLDAQINQNRNMIGKILEVLIPPFFLQLALGFAVFGWIINEDEKNAKEADEIRKRYNNKRTRE